MSRRPECCAAPRAQHLERDGAETAFRIELRNAKDEKVSVRVQEPLPGDWELVHESHASRKESARVVSWQVEVPARGSAQLDYTVRVRW